MKRSKIILMALLVALIPAGGWCADETTTPPPQPSAGPADIATKLSKPTRDVVKMVASGVPDDVVKAYIQNGYGNFNLTPENIIHLQGVGVSASITSEMLSHDKQLRDQAAVAPAPAPPGQPVAPAVVPSAEPQPVYEAQNPVSVYTIPADNYVNYYGELAPYGSWGFVTGYGWCWQPRFGLSYAYYPWGVLGSGRWGNCPGRGWCWFPGSRFHGFQGSGNRFVGSRFGGTRGFVTGQNHFHGGSSVFVMHHSAGSTFHSSGGFHGSSGGFGHGSGGHSGGGHWSGGHSSGHSFGGGRSGGFHR